MELAPSITRVLDRELQIKQGS